MENKGRIAELITDSDNGKSFAIVSIVLLIGFSFHGFTFIVSIDDEIRAKYAESEFKIQFFELEFFLKFLLDFVIIPDFDLGLVFEFELELVFEIDLELELVFEIDLELELDIDCCVTFV